MATSIADTVQSQYEAVIPVLTKIYESSDQLAGLVRKAGNVHQVSRWLLRWPLKKYHGGTGGKYNADGGAIPVGTSQAQAFLRSGYYRFALMFRLNKEQIDTASSDKQAVVNILNDQMAGGTIEMQVMDDIHFHQSGNGILTEASSAVVGAANATMTFAAATDMTGINKLHEGMAVDVWTSDGATKRAPATAAPIIIINIDYDSKTVTLNQDVTGLTVGDVIAVYNLDATGPSTLTTFNSTYPGTPPITGTGISGDSFRHGFPYFTDPTAANYFYGTQKSAVSQLLPVSVNAGGDPLTWEHGQRIVAKIKQKRDGDVWRNLTGIAHASQKAALFNMGISISQKLIGGQEFGPSLDLVPSNQAYTDSFMFATMKHVESKRQRRDQIDYVDFSKVGKAQLQDMRPLDLNTGRTMFEGRTGDGALAAYVEWGLETSYDFILMESGGCGRIYDLAMPSPEWDA